MKRGTAAVAAPTSPQVNLLPEEIRARRTLGTVKRWATGSLAATALVVGAVTAAAVVERGIADSELAQADAETTALLTQQRPFSEVTTVRAEVASVAEARAAALAGEVLWSGYLDALVAMTPDGVRISGLDYLGASPTAPAPASADPLVDAGLGTLTFTAVAREIPDTATWADALETVPGLSDARISSARLGDAGNAEFRYTVTGSVQVDAAALSHRFDTATGGDS